MNEPAINRANFDAARKRLMEELSVTGFNPMDARALAAMSHVPRHEFVPDDKQSLAYTDMALPIGHGQTISQPYIVVLMTTRLNLQPSDRVLEIGTGSGYQAAVLAQLAAEVHTVEIIEPLSQRAAATLSRLGCHNVHLHVGDGCNGWPEAAPFDAVIVTCAPEQVPQPLVEQLKDGGRMIIPIGPEWDQNLVLLRKQGGRLEQSAVLPVRFVPMTGWVRR